MQRSFGTEISGNRRPGAELSEAQRAGILSAVEAGEEKTEIAARYRVTRRVIYNTIDRWNNHHTLKSRSPSVNEAPAPLPPSNRTDQRLQHQATYGMEPLDRLIGVHIRKVQETVASLWDIT